MHASTSWLPLRVHASEMPFGSGTPRQTLPACRAVVVGRKFKGVRVRRHLESRPGLCGFPRKFMDAMYLLSGAYPRRLVRVGGKLEEDLREEDN